MAGRAAGSDFLASRKDACSRFSSPQDADGFPTDATVWQLLGAALHEEPLQVLGGLAEVEGVVDGHRHDEFRDFHGRLTLVRLGA